jgi:hypothetical protein
VVVERLRRRLFGDERRVGSRLHLGVHVLLDREDLFVGGVALGHEPLGERRDRVAQRIGLALLGRAVEDFVVGQ